MTLGHLRARPAAPADRRRAVGVLLLEVAVGGRADAEVGDRRELLPVEPGRAVGQLPVRQEAEDLAAEPARVDGRGEVGRDRRRAGSTDRASIGRSRPGRRRTVAAAAGDRSRPGRPAARPARSRRAATGGRPGARAARPPPTGQRSTARGVNGTVTRSPGAKSVGRRRGRRASSYWIVGWRPSATAGPAGSAAGDGAGRDRSPARTSRPAADARRGARRTRWRRGRAMRAAGRHRHDGPRAEFQGLRRLGPAPARGYGTKVPVRGGTVQMWCGPVRSPGRPRRRLSGAGSRSSSRCAWPLMSTPADLERHGAGAAARLELERRPCRCRSRSWSSGTLHVGHARLVDVQRVGARRERLGRGHVDRDRLAAARRRVARA